MKFTVVVLVLTSTMSSALDPAPYSLRYVIAFFRHGIRSPLFPSIIPNNPNKEKCLELAGGGLGGLTTIGKQQMFAVGQRLRERYGPFIDGYQEDKVTVTSTNTSRTMMSALTVMAAMFPPCPRIFQDLLWQPIPVCTDTAEFDKHYLVANLKSSECPKYCEMWSELVSISRSRDTRKDHQRIYELIRQQSGDDGIDTPSHLTKLYDTLYCEARNSLQLPAWSVEPQKEFNNRPLFPDLLFPIYAHYFGSAIYYKKNENMLGIFSGPLLNAVTSRFLRISADLSTPDRFWYHSTHDTTIYPLLRGLGVDDPMTAEPGDGVLLELHVEDGEQYVKIYVYSAICEKIIELVSPLCPKPCTLNRFSTCFKGLNPQQWEGFCKN